MTTPTKQHEGEKSSSTGNSLHQHTSSQQSFQSSVSQDQSFHSQSSHCSFPTNAIGSTTPSGGDDISNSSCFFADMTLDINMAQMETTPRTDLKFATMATNTKDATNKKVGIAGNKSVREELIKSVPPMPLIEEPTSTTDFHQSNNVADNNDGWEDDSDEYGLVEEDISPNSRNSHDNHKFDDNNNNVNPISSSGATTQHAAIEEGGEQFESSYNNASLHSYYSTTTSSSIRPTRVPRRPRDVSWAAAALLIIPLGLFIPREFYISTKCSILVCFISTIFFKTLYILSKTNGASCVTFSYFVFCIANIFI